MGLHTSCDRVFIEHYIPRFITQPQSMSTSWYQFHFLCSFNANNLRKSIFRASREMFFSKLTGVAPYHDGYFPTAFRIFANHVITFNPNTAFDTVWYCLEFHLTFAPLFSKPEAVSRNHTLRARYQYKTTKNNAFGNSLLKHELKYGLSDFS